MEVQILFSWDSPELFNFFFMDFIQDQAYVWVMKINYIFEMLWTRGKTRIHIFNRLYIKVPYTFVTVVEHFKGCPKSFKNPSHTCAPLLQLLRCLLMCLCVQFTHHTRFTITSIIIIVAINRSVQSLSVPSRINKNVLNQVYLCVWNDGSNGYVVDLSLSWTSDTVICPNGLFLHVSDGQVLTVVDNSTSWLILQQAHCK